MKINNVFARNARAARADNGKDLVRALARSLRHPVWRRSSTMLRAQFLWMGACADWTSSSLLSKKERRKQGCAPEIMANALCALTILGDVVSILRPNLRIQSPYTVFAHRIAVVRVRVDGTRPGAQRSEERRAGKGRWLRSEDAQPKE